MVVSGGLSIAGMAGVPLANLQLRMIGVVGCVGVGSVVLPLLALVFGRARSRPVEAG